MNSRLQHCFCTLLVTWGLVVGHLTMLNGQCGTLDNPSTDQQTYCAGEQMLLSIDGFNLKNGTEVEWYWSLTSGFDPYADDGIYIGDDEGIYDHTEEDPNVGSIMVDGCGTGSNGETMSEYVIIESGGGMYIDDFEITLDSNNAGAGNLASPGSSGCPWTSGYTSFISGCSSVVGVGPGDYVPANSILIVQTSSDYSYQIDASPLCGIDDCIYVVRSTCNRVGFGAFTDGGIGVRTTVFDFGSTSQTITYDRADINAEGYYVEGNENVGNVSCNGTASPGLVTNYDIPTTYDDVSFTVPDTWCGSTIYFKAIVDENETGDCCDEISSEEISLTFVCPNANPAGPLSVCEENGTYTYDLTLLDATLSGGSGSVTWYSDAITSTVISTPTGHQTSNTSVWAVVSSGGCMSLAEEVLLNQLSSPSANPFNITGCTALMPYNLDTEANPNINSTESITWYETDPSGGGANQIGPPTDAVDLNPYNGGSIWAQVEDANGCTTVQEVNISADDIPEGCLSGSLDICESGCEEFTFSFTGGSGTYNAEVIFTFLGFSFGPFTLPAVSNTTGFTLCLDPDIILPQFPSGGITLPTCPIPILLCLEEGDIISLELISVVDANTGCPGTVGSNCIQSIEFHSDPDIDVNQVDDTCFGETTGMIDLEISNGNPAYNYTWDNGLPSIEDQVDLGAGTYAVTVTDDLGCSATEMITINELNAIQIQEITDDETCDGDDDGMITIIASDGMAPYSYDWDNDIYDGLDILTDIPDGNYTVTVTDDNGCTSESTITITPGATLILPTFSINNVYCQNDLEDLLVSTSDNAINGNWNPTMIDTDLAGVTTHTFTPDPGQCSQPTDLIVTVVTEPLLTLFDYQCDGSEYTFEVEVEGSPNTTYELTGSSVTPPNTNTVTTNGSGFGSATFVLPNTTTNATLQVLLPTSPFCTSNIETINPPICDCPTVTLASGSQIVCYGELPDLSDIATGFSIDNDPNGFAGNLVWTTNNIDPDNGGILYTPTPELNETCSPITLELFAWLPCEIGGTVDSYVPSGSISVIVNPNQPMLVINSIADPVCSGALSVVNYYLATADGVQCSTILELDAEDNLSCSLDLQILTISIPFTEVRDIMGVTNNDCNTYVNIIDSESIEVLPSGFTINTTGDGNCTELTADLLALDGTVCDTELLSCQDNSTTLDYDFGQSLGFLQNVDCTYDNLSGSLACGNCVCPDPVIVTIGDDLVLCPLAGNGVDLTSVDASISGSVTDGKWSGGSGSFDSTIFSQATQYTISQADIDAGSVMLTLTSDTPSNPECNAVSEVLLLTFFDMTDDIIINETHCIDSGYTYVSPSGEIYNVDFASGMEQLTDVNGCGYQVTVDLTFLTLPEIEIINIECGTNQDYSVEFNIVGNLDSYSAGILNGNIIESIPNDTPLTLNYSNAGQCTQIITLPNPNCDCPDISSPISLGNPQICEGDQIPALEVSESIGTSVNWYSDVLGTDFLETGVTYTPQMAGTYYAQSVDNATGCTSTNLTAVTLTILAPPTIESIVSCSMDGLSYQVEFTITSTTPAQFTTSTGSSTDLGNDQYLVEDIDINANLNIAYSLIGIDCGDILIISPPQCNCNEINPPNSLGDATICSGEDIPRLEVTVDAGHSALWYSDELLTNLVSTGTSYLPSEAGTYYVIAEEISTGCQSTLITPLVLTIVELPIPLSFAIDCSDDLATYTVTIEYENNQNVVLSANGGILTELPNATYQISNIPAGVNLGIVLSSTLVNDCDNETNITAPQCGCPPIDPPVSQQTVDYCIGEPIPPLIAVADDGLDILWYADMQLTELLFTGNQYTPILQGTYYVVADDTSIDCQSMATAVTLTENLLPQLTSFEVFCDENDPSFYIVEFFQSSENIALVSAGSPITADGTFVRVINIPIDVDLIIDLTHTPTDCQDSVVIPAPNCDCTDTPIVQLTVPESICENDVIVLEATGTGFVESTWQTDGDGTFANSIDLNTIYTPGVNDIATGMVLFEFVTNDPDDEGPCEELVTSELVIIELNPDQPSVDSVIEFCTGDNVDLDSILGPGYNWYDNSLNLLNDTPQVNTTEANQLIYYISQTVGDCESDLLQLLISVTEVYVDYTIIPACIGDLFGQITIEELDETSNDYIITANGIDYNTTLDDLPLSFPYPINTPVTFSLSNALGCSLIVSSQDMISELDYQLDIEIEQIGINSYSLSYVMDITSTAIDNQLWESSQELSCNTCSTPTIVINQDETVSLTITTEEGCLVTDDRVLVYQEQEIFVPNIFTPGKGDNNSIFYPQSGENLGTINQLSIYDRWGTLIFNSTMQALNDPQAGWDGTSNGSLVEQGVYIYVLEIETLTNEIRIMTGDITVVR